MSRRLHGRRGLKSKGTGDLTIPDKSPPSRAAWIEIVTGVDDFHCILRRRLHGRRGLKSVQSGAKIELISRRLHGRRGLKCPQIDNLDIPNRRRLHGRRGLKLLEALIEASAEYVAAFTGGVD
mgnify:CR=1 FL=1